MKRFFIVLTLLLMTAGSVHCSVGPDEGRSLTQKEIDTVIYHYFINDISRFTGGKSKERNVDLIIRGIIRGLEDQRYSGVLDLYTSDELALTKMIMKDGFEESTIESSSDYFTEAQLKGLLPANEKELYCYSYGVSLSKNRKYLSNAIKFKGLLSNKEFKLVFKGYRDNTRGVVLFDVGGTEMFYKAFKSEIQNLSPKFFPYEKSYDEVEEFLFSIVGRDYADFLSELYGMKIGSRRSRHVKRYEFSDAEILLALKGVKDYLVDGFSKILLFNTAFFADFLKQRERELYLKNSKIGDEYIKNMIETDQSYLKSSKGLVYKIVEEGNGKKIDTFDRFSYKIQIKTLDGEILYKSRYGEYETSPLFDAIKLALGVISEEGKIEFFASAELLYKNELPEIINGSNKFGEAFICELELSKIY